MASGSSEVATGTDATAALHERLHSDEVLSVVATPDVRQALAAAVIAHAASAPHVRIVGPDRPPIADGADVTTAPGLVEADLDLSPYTPLADALDAVDRESLPQPLTEAIEAVQAVGDDPSPGLVATHDDLETAIARSLRLPRVDTPGETSIDTLDDDARRALGSYLVAEALAEDPPAATARAVADGLGPTYIEAGPAPTAEGVADLLETALAVDPGGTTAALLGDGGWPRILATYESTLARVDTVVDDAPAGVPGEVAATAADDVPVAALCRRWAATSLAADYGVVTVGEAPAVVGLVAPGERSASAVLETVTGRRGGSAWGGPFVAAAALAAAPTDPAATIEEAL